MASIPIVRYDYGSSEYAGFPPFKATPNLTSLAVTLASGSAGNTIGADETYGEAEFKDHKTVFTFINTSGASTNITFKAGDTYGAKDKVVTIPSGTSDVVIDSTPGADKKTGQIKVVTTVASVAAYGVEFR